MADKLIVIIKEDLKLGAILTVGRDKIKYEFFNGFSQENIEDFHNLVKENKQTLTVYRQDEHGQRVIDSKHIGNDDPKYLHALAEELRKRNFSAAVIEQENKKFLLQYDRANLSLGQREDILGDVLNISPDKALDLANFIDSLARP
jgi:hypothetical protein